MGLFSIFKKKPDYNVPWPDVVKRTFEEDNEIHEILQKFADGRINAHEIDPKWWDESTAKHNAMLAELETELNQLQSRLRYHKTAKDKAAVHVDEQQIFYVKDQIQDIKSSMKSLTQCRQVWKYQIDHS